MYKRILTVQDISCFGQCSLTVALPILSACGHETVILPTAVLSTHTAGFTGFTVRDLADDLPGISAHWQKEGITFDAICTGYLGNEAEIDTVADIIDKLIVPGGTVIIDPAMADHGKLYPAFDMDYAKAMNKLVAKADYILPNITEAAFLTGIEYREDYDEKYISELLDGLSKNCKGSIILTGVSYEDDSTGIVVRENGNDRYYKHKLIKENRHGTGDIYTAAFAGALLSGCGAYESAVIAGDYTVACLEDTVITGGHQYGACFEPRLCDLKRMIDKK